MYKQGNEFLSDIIHPVKTISDSEVEFKDPFIEALKFALQTNKVYVKTIFSDKDAVKYDDSNFEELLVDLDANWQHLIDFRMNKFSYGYTIHYTDSWKDQLVALRILKG
ncbi:hypothetical protein [Mangrovimonas cancribranchiae]|uniref:Uncharacterized protein n=1 Tax=Mangrovimonas cancribranchiae TaxID=3080055 RepID=A0AAU6P5E0_9FLAO